MARVTSQVILALASTFGSCVKTRKRGWGRRGTRTSFESLSGVVLIFPAFLFDDRVDGYAIGSSYSSSAPRIVVSIVELHAVGREIAWSFVVLVVLILPIDKHLGQLWRGWRTLRRRWTTSRMSVELPWCSLRSWPGHSYATKIKIELKSAGARWAAGGIARSAHAPKMMTAMSTEHSTPSLYAFLKRPFFRWEAAGREAMMVGRRLRGRLQGGRSRIEKICQDISTKLVTREFQRRVSTRAHLEKGHRQVAFVLQENGHVSIAALEGV